MVEILPCATCGAHCPVHTDTRSYVDLIARGRYEEAFERIRERNPFPSVCGLICHHPCEQSCRRGDVDEPVALRHLKRFAVEQASEYRKRLRKLAILRSEKKVGIVGAGPAGLTAAADVIREGFGVTVYEAHSTPGGLLAHAIPRYRLPLEILQEDLDDLLALGVKVSTGVRVGQDISLQQLCQRHDAVVLATGLSLSRSLPLEHGEHPDVHLALPFLQSAATGVGQDIRERVVVIGGGNVAVDVARTAIRLGAKSVSMVCLENEEEMPAWDWECQEALEEGIAFLYRRGPVAVTIEQGRIVGLVTRQVQRVFDEQGSFSPLYLDDVRETIPCQMVIIAVGQEADLSFVREEDGLNKDSSGRLVFDHGRMSASRDGVFACGEVVTGPGSAIEAVASGHRAARAVIAFLNTGNGLLLDAEEIHELSPLPSSLIDRVKKTSRTRMPVLDAQIRRRNFDPFELGFKEEEALREARRCLSCAAGARVDEAKCVACLACLRVCPFGVPEVKDVACMASEMCQACGLCAAECPALAISITRFSPGDLRRRVSDLLGNTNSSGYKVEFRCMQDVYTREDLMDRWIQDKGEMKAVVMVPCAALVDEVDMMKPFEWDAASVVVRHCSGCRYEGAEDRIQKRLARTKLLLEEAGVGKDLLTLEGPKEEPAE